jgi:hypothetical protein
MNSLGMPSALGLFGSSFIPACAVLSVPQYCDQRNTEGASAVKGEQVQLMVIPSAGYCRSKKG